MLIKVRGSKVGAGLCGCHKVIVPVSKSHTIRAIFFASLALGTSEIECPLISQDTISAINACRAFGAEIQIQDRNKLMIKGFNGIPDTPCNIINVGNSGTTLAFVISMAALCQGSTMITGDEQIRNRIIAPLLDALNNLGATCSATTNSNMAPVEISGLLAGGTTSLECVTSQFLSSILIHAPLFKDDTELNITKLNEIPYVEMTLSWLDRFNIIYENYNLHRFLIRGTQKYNAFKTKICGDYSSATFFMAHAAISGNEFILENLDSKDTQGDKKVLSILKDMGAEVTIFENKVIIKGDKLIGTDIDMNSIPDALPAMAVVGCFAQGETRLYNVAQARLKETDRIHVMYKELTKMGANITETEDGLIIKQSKLKCCRVNGNHDHRIVMALTIAALNVDGETTIETAEAIKVTFPEFIKILKSCGADIN